ncbi:hypothetical protein [Nocardia inohanensis]|uniref:hypothetical protein n=1 Tax=Nocardia inohanensis TaxID=209246 RepID=UPI000829C499|nr:hypothetical protein [Nocardia inohanensis]
MSEPLDVLERNIAALRRAIRDASTSGDAERATELRAQLRRAERAWDALLDTTEPAPARAEDPAAGAATKSLVSQAMMLPAREHAHRALMLLQAPAAPKLIVTVHEAFFRGELSAAKLSSLRRDEERSYRTAPGARPYYLCPALNYDLLGPARALITISTWSLEQRILGPLSPRVDFLTSTINIAKAVHLAGATGIGPTPAALRLLWRFAATITDATASTSTAGGVGVDPQRVIDAAAAELAIHESADQTTRAEAARRARKQLTEEQQLFGISMRQINQVRTGS